MNKPTTITLDLNLKRQALEIIMFKMNSTLSNEVTKLCKYIIQNKNGVEIAENKLGVAENESKN